MIGKLCSGSWGGAIFPPDDAITIEGAVKIKASKNKNRGGVIFRFLIRSTSPDVSGLFFITMFINGLRIVEKLEA
jgi:hypothetical protein